MSNVGCSNCAGSDRLTWRQLIFSFLGAVIGVSVLGAVIYGKNQATAAAPACLTREQVATAVRDLKKCYTIYDNGVFDLTAAKKWDLTGHVGKHLCGKEYDKETIEKGPHNVDVMKPFYLTKVCGSRGPVFLEVAKPAKEGWPKTVLGMSWMKFSSYLALLFFLLNFATCYAMPWAGIKEPWRGDLPGRDKKDLLGAFPLTHWHKIWAWLAIFSLSFHGLLGFSGILFGKWY